MLSLCNVIGITLRKRLQLRNSSPKIRVSLSMVFVGLGVQMMPTNPAYLKILVLSLLNKQINALFRFPFQMYFKCFSV